MRSVLIIIILLFIGFSNDSVAQKQSVEDSIKYIQFSGFTLDADSLVPVPQVLVYNKTKKRRFFADQYGYFSLVASPGDQIRFSHATYESSLFTIPDTIVEDKYTIYQMMSVDTNMLQAVFIYPWPSREEFADAFVNLDIPDDDLDRARANLAMAEMRERTLGTPGSGDINFKWDMANYQAKLYHSGQAPPIQLLNPVAWGKFIKAWKNGDFKRKDK